MEILCLAFLAMLLGLCMAVRHVNETYHADQLDHFLLHQQYTVVFRKYAAPPPLAHKRPLHFECKVLLRYFYPAHKPSPHSHPQPVFRTRRRKIVWSTAYSVFVPSATLVALQSDCFMKMTLRTA